MLVLALTILLAPALVVASTLAGRRLGPAVAGTLVALPVVAGPILLVAHLEHGPAFSSAAARSALLGLVALAAFAVVLGHLAARAAWPAALAPAWVACLLVDVALVRWHPGPVAGLAAAIASCAVGTALLPRAPGSTGPVPRPPSWDLPTRAAATAVLVLTLTGASAALGPDLTGVLAPFPVASSVVAAFTLAQHGPGATVAVLRGLLRGLVGFAVFCACLAVLVDRTGTALAFSAALAASLATQVAVHAVVRARAADVDAAPRPSRLARRRPLRSASAPRRGTPGSGAPTPGRPSAGPRPRAPGARTGRS